jgi:hypothetical protein
MSRKFLILILVTGLFPQHIQAATEYLRFEGSIINAYREGQPGFDASFGFVRNQSVYFDFQIDTTLDVVGQPPDDDVRDIFAATYLSGSIAVADETYGQTITFAEGITSELLLTGSLRVGISWPTLNDLSMLPDPVDESINTWKVGDNIELFNYSSDDAWWNIIGELTMTYRELAPPPAIVPIPAALWLFGSGLLCLIGLARKKSL